MARITIIMPVYNGEKYIRQAIDSILNQTFKDWKLLCIDDCSSDNSVKIIQSYDDDRIELICNDKNRGIAFSRNVGLENAQTEYIALLDDDDIAIPYRLEKEIEYLDAHHDIDVVGGHQRQIDGKGNDLNKQWSVPLNPNYVKAYLLFNNCVVNGSTMFRRNFIEKNNIRYKDNMCGAEDYMFWVECSLHGKIKNLDNVFLLWRVAGQNETFNMIGKHSDMRYEALKKIKKYAIEANGFKISEPQLEIICKCFYEDGVVDNRQELIDLYSALKSISEQAKNMKIDNVQEIVTMCRKRFGEKVGKAFFLW